MAKLRSSIKTALKLVFLYVIWDRIKSMVWDKTKTEAKQKVKSKTGDNIEPEWVDEETA